MHPALSGRFPLRLSLLLPVALLLACGGGTTPTAKVPPPAYFSQALAGETPVPFAPEKLGALSSWVESTAFSPDGTLFFASVGSADWSTSKLYLSTFVNGAWTPFVEPLFLVMGEYDYPTVISLNYVCLHCERGSHLLRGTLSALEGKLDPLRFLRIHRSWIVNLEQVREAQPWTKGTWILLTRSGLKIPVGQQYREALLKILG